MTTMRTIRPLPRHFYSLDAVRGLAALAVVFWHWQHFFYPITAAKPFFQQGQPLYAVFAPLYTDGWRAVDFFFCASGFIFFWLYSEKIADRKVGAREFWLLRFSRLYPLHLITLFIVAIGQALFRQAQGEFFVYPNNDLYHFILNLFFASAWKLERGVSFNGPTWSVSIEILLYGIFFLLCFFRLTRWWYLLLIAGLGYGLIERASPGTSNLGQGLLGFFIGTLAFKVFHRVRLLGLPYPVIAAFGAGACLLWAATPFVMAQAKNSPPVAHYCELILFPCSIIVLALLECYRGTLGRRIAWVGNISYSSYLLHFPLQLVFISVVLSVSRDRSFFYSTKSLLLFFACLVPLSLGTYYGFERFAQKWLRNRFLTSRQSREEKVKA